MTDRINDGSGKSAESTSTGHRLLSESQSLSAASITSGAKHVMEKVVDFTVDIYKKVDAEIERKVDNIFIVSIKPQKAEIHLRRHPG